MVTQLQSWVNTICRKIRKSVNWYMEIEFLGRSYRPSHIYKDNIRGSVHRLSITAKSESRRLSNSIKSVTSYDGHVNGIKNYTDKN